jgi:TrmH family RNA methyltransferase
VSSDKVVSISSRDNPLLKELRKVSQDPTAYRAFGRVWLEGDHLCRAALQRGVRPAVAVFCESYWPTAPAEWSQGAAKIVLMPDALFRSLSALESPARMGFVVEFQPQELAPGVPTVVLDRVQDAGNVGSILRSAAAFGFRQVVAVKGTAGLWSPKVLRAGMGAHFGLRLVEGADVADLKRLAVPLVATSSHQGVPLRELKLPKTCAWVFGHEGQGVSEPLMGLAETLAQIEQPGGEESLNVAAAAAICLHASAVSA